MLIIDQSGVGTKTSKAKAIKGKQVKTKASKVTGAFDFSTALQLYQELVASASMSVSMSVSTSVGQAKAGKAADDADADDQKLPDFWYPMDLSSGRCSNDTSQRPSSFDSLGFTLFWLLINAAIPGEWM